MTLKHRLAAMMILLLVAVMIVQLLLAERERRNLMDRFSRLRTEVEQSTLRLSQKTHRMKRSPVAASDSTLLEFQDEIRDIVQAGTARLQVIVIDDSLSTGRDGPRKLELLPTGERLHEITLTIDGELPVAMDSLPITQDVFRRIRTGIRPDSLQTHRTLWTARGDSLGAITELTDIVVNFPLPAVENDSLLAMQLRFPFHDLTEQLDRSRRSSLMWTSLLLLVGVVGSFLMASQFTRPLRGLQFSFGRVQKGDLDVHLSPKRGDEIGHLTESFNEMVRRLREKREIEHRLRDVEHLASLGRMAAGIAHEIRNPLNTILLSLQQLRDKLPPDSSPDGKESFQRYYSLITGEVGRLERLVGTFLDLSRSADLTLTPLDLTVSLRSSVELFSSQARQRNIRFELDLPTEAPFQGDPTRLPTVWNNLLANAVEASDPGKTVRIELAEDHDDWILRFTDAGCGVEAGIQEKVWEPFYSAKENGAGLGLSIVRSVIEAHGGEVALHSTPGEGSCFEIHLPRSGEARTT